MSKWITNYTKEHEFMSWAANQVIEWNLIARTKHDFTLTEIKRQNNLFQDEVDEALLALKSGDKAEFLKELCDVFVTYSYGLFLGKAVEPSPADFYSVDTRITWSWEGTLEILQKSSSWEHIYQLLAYFDGDWQDALTLVILSNFSKFEDYDPRNVDEYNMHCFELMSTGRYLGVTWMLYNSNVVYKDSNGKILKGRNYSEPNLDTCVGSDDVV